MMYKIASLHPLPDISPLNIGLEMPTPSGSAPICAPDMWHESPQEPESGRGETHQDAAPAETSDVEATEQVLPSHASDPGEGTSGPAESLGSLQLNEGGELKSEQGALLS